jgi:NAD(P)-dependent dehydrogenase (short-subunit alcohol dehydrogenase family)
MAQEKQPGTVLVTGAGRRLGRLIALDFARKGWRVGVHYNASADDAARVVAEIEAQGGRAVALAGDLARIEPLAPLVEACAAALGPPTCLINNAARFDFDTLATLTPSSWQAHLDVNLRAPVFLAQAFARMLPAGREGNIVNLIDQKVLRLDPDYFSYTVAKAALVSATQMMAQALGPRIRVNAIAPGPVLPSQGQSEAEFAEECRATLLGRAVDAKDVLGAIRFLLETPSVTGQMIALDAGQHLAWRSES